MKRISITTFLLIASLLLTVLYSCIKDGLADPAPFTKAKTINNNNFIYADSGCSVCVENKQVVLTPAKFLGPFLGPGVEMNSKYGRATISDMDVQAHKKINISVLDANGYETAIPLFVMATDGSYESIYYKRVSSSLMICYVRFNNSTNTFSFKPASDLTVRYGLAHTN